MPWKLNTYSAYATPYLQMTAYESKTWAEQKFFRIYMFIYSKPTNEWEAVKCKKLSLPLPFCMINRGTEN